MRDRSDAFVEIVNASRHFRAVDPEDGAPATLHAVDGVSLDIRRGECLALVGESGSGKSTLARLIVNLLPLTSGRIVVAGTDLSTATRAEVAQLRRRAQIVFQDPYSSLDPRFSVREIVAEGLPKLTKSQRHARVGDLLDAVGLSGDFVDRYPHQLSGGQRQRVSVARALAVEPELIVLDEPVSALDVSMQAQVLNLLAELRTRLGLTFLFISHDLGVVHHVADRVAVMYLGQVVEIADVEDLFTRPQHPYTHALLSAMPNIELGRRRRRVVLEGDLVSPINPPSNCRLASRCFRAQDRCHSEEPDAAIVGGGHRVACFFPGALTPAEAGAPPTNVSAAAQETS